MAGDPGAAESESRPGGEDDFRRSATAVSGALCGWTVANLTAPDQAMACQRGPRAGSVLCAGASGRRAVRVRLHPPDGVEDHHRWPDFSAHAVPLRADVLQLGDGNHLSF